MPKYPRGTTTEGSDSPEYRRDTMFDLAHFGNNFPTSDCHKTQIASKSPKDGDLSQ